MASREADHQTSRDRAAEERDDSAERRDDSADERDVAARARDAAAADRDRESRSRDERVRARRRTETDRLAAIEPEQAQEGWLLSGGDREELRAFLNRLHEYQVAVAADRRAAAEDRQAAAEDRRAAARDRELGAWARQQAAVEYAERSPDQAPSGGETGADPGDRAEPPTEQGQLGARTELNIALRVATSRETEALESAQQAAALAGQVADSEERIAATLQELYSRGDPAIDARRLALAQEAAKGATVALARGERLRALAELAKDHLERATLRTLLGHASTAFGQLSRAERAIANALDLLAAHEQPAPAAEHHREAARAREAAGHAMERAEELHRLEVSTGEPPPEPPAAGPETAEPSAAGPETAERPAAGQAPTEPPPVGPDATERPEG